MKKMELLIPAGSPEALRTAVLFGADAVYAGGPAYGLRAKAKNFTLEQLAEEIGFAHQHGVKVFVTVNIIAHERHFEDLEEYLIALRDMGADALIVADAGIAATALETVPDLPVHLSTQASATNSRTMNFWHRQGVKRIVCAREISMEELAEIRRNTPESLELEVFVHAAMCVSISGRCLLSNYLTGRDANLGECTHPCRWRYYLTEETRPGEYMPVFENERGTFIFNSKDLCMVDHIPEIVDAGIDSLKVEGRMKTALYVATVARAYRNAIDTFFEDPEEYKKNIPVYFDEIGKCTNRRFTTGFYFGKPGTDSMVYENSTYVKEYVYYGTVRSVAENADGTFTGVLEQKNKFCVGDSLEILAPGRILCEQTKVISITNEQGEQMQSCPHASQIIYVTVDRRIREGDLFRGKAV